MSSISASHMLIKYEGSRNPRSFRDPQGLVITKTSLKEAWARVEKIREAIVSGRMTFADAAKQYSDCGSAKNGGDLGTFKHGDMQKAFSDVAYATAIGEVSDPFVSDSGVHIILRTA